MPADLCADFLDDTYEYMDRAIQDTSLSVDEISDVVLLGGSMNLSEVKSYLKSRFGYAKVHMGTNSDHAIAIGVAAYGYLASGKTENVTLTEYSLQDIVPRTLGVVVSDGNHEPFILQAEKVSVAARKPLRPKSSTQAEALFSIREGEGLNNGMNNP